MRSAVSYVASRFDAWQVILAERSQRAHVCTQGPENFSYYDALLERVMELFGDRRLAVFFIDIACRCMGWFEMCTSRSSCMRPTTWKVTGIDTSVVYI